MGKNDDLINAVANEYYENVKKLLQKSQKSGLFSSKKLNINYQVNILFLMFFIFLS